MSRVRFPYPAHKTHGSDAKAFGSLCFTAGKESKDGGREALDSVEVAESGEEVLMSAAN
jgi:hypothetical protein